MEKFKTLITRISYTEDEKKHIWKDIYEDGQIRLGVSLNIESSNYVSSVSIRLDMKDDNYEFYINGVKDDDISQSECSQLYKMIDELYKKQEEQKKIASWDLLRL